MPTRPPDDTTAPAPRRFLVDAWTSPRMSGTADPLPAAPLGTPTPPPSWPACTHRAAIVDRIRSRPSSGLLVYVCPDCRHTWEVDSSD